MFEQVLLVCQEQGLLGNELFAIDSRNIATTKRLTRFSLRGKRKVQGQWQLYCLVHNIEKLANYGQLAA